MGISFRYGTFAMSRGELGFRLNVVLFILPAAVLVAALLAEWPGAGLVAAFDALDRRLSRIWLVAAMLVTLELVALVRFGVLRAGPITDDENVYLFQARLLAAGHLSIGSLPESVRAFFDNQFIINNGRWFGMYFIGHGAMLALGLATGLVQWIGAIEAALTVPLAIGIARRVYGGRVAALAGVFLVLSPFFIFVSATHLSQPTSSLFLALFVYSAVRIEAAAREVRWWVVAAAALSAAAIVRPQAAAVVALPFLARLAVLLARRQIAPTALGLGAGLLVLGLGATAFLSINHALTGHALRTSYHAYWETVRPLDFRTGPWYPFRELAQNLAHLNFWLFGWPLSLAFVPFFRRSGLGLTLAAVPGLLLAGQALLGVPTVAAVGPVYFAEAIVPLAILSASGFAEAVAWARRRFADAWPTRFVLAAPVAGTLARPRRLRARSGCLTQAHGRHRAGPLRSRQGRAADPCRGLRPQSTRAAPGPGGLGLPPSQPTARSERRRVVRAGPRSPSERGSRPLPRRPNAVRHGDAGRPARARAVHTLTGLGVHRPGEHGTAPRGPADGHRRRDRGRARAVSDRARVDRAGTRLSAPSGRIHGGRSRRHAERTQSPPAEAGQPAAALDWRGPAHGASRSAARRQSRHPSSASGRSAPQPASGPA